MNAVTTFLAPSSRQFHCNSRSPYHRRVVVSGSKGCAHVSVGRKRTHSWLGRCERRRTLTGVPCGESETRRELTSLWLCERWAMRGPARSSIGQHRRLGTIGNAVFLLDRPTCARRRAETLRLQIGSHWLAALYSLTTRPQRISGSCYRGTAGVRREMPLECLEKWLVPFHPTCRIIADRQRRLVEPPPRLPRAGELLFQSAIPNIGN